MAFRKTFWENLGSNPGESSNTMELFIIYAVVAVITLIVITDRRTATQTFTTMEAVIAALLWPLMLLIFVFGIIIALVKT